MSGLRIGLGAASLALVAAIVSCKHNPTAPNEFAGATATDPVLLSGGSPTSDEDPSVLQATDGTTYVAWYSNRGGIPDIYLSSSTDLAAWTPALRVTTGANGDFYPNLLQDSHGVLHLVWFQWVSLFVGQIRHASSADGVTWTPEDAVTTDLLVDDWVPTVAEGPDGSLLVYFASAKRASGNNTNEIWMAARRPGHTTWDPPVRLSINSPTEHDHLPFVARTGANQLTLVWVRYAGDSDFISNPRSDLYSATSSDGLTWSAPTRVTTDGKGQNLFAQLYRRHDGSWRLLWLSTRTGSPLLYEMPVTGLGAYPSGVEVEPLLPPGYSHRVAATSRPGEYLAAWVQGTKGAEDIYTRLITLPGGK